jgi:hypothetical protein
MSQKPLTDFGAQSSKTSGLKPPVAAALASLEVQLDQELARYRRTRTGTRTLNQARLGNYNSSSTQQLTVMTTTLDDIQSSVGVNTNPPPTSVTDTLEDEPLPATVKTEEVDHLNLSLTSESTKTQDPQTLPNSGSSIVPAGIQIHKSENLSQGDDTPTELNDYLESSAALRRSLTAEQPQTRKPSNSSSDSLLSPLGIGSMLLLLMASLTLGYIVFNPKILSQINLAKLFQSDSSPAVNQSQKVETKSSPQPQPQPSLIPKYPYPNLANKEFPTVSDPKDVVGLQPKIQPIPAPLPNSVPLPQPINPIDTIPAPSVLPKPQINSQLNPTTKTPQKLPTATPSTANTEIKPSADGFYHIVTDNQSDKSLTAARQIVPDAYLSLDNKLIYLGAVKTQQEVQQQLQQLQSKGIKARVKQP